MEHEIGGYPTFTLGRIREKAMECRRLRDAGIDPIDHAHSREAEMREFLQEDLNHPGITVHGFLSSFRDCCAEMTNYPRELAEAALAHSLKDKTEVAYQCGDLLEKRRTLMQVWAALCSGESEAHTNPGVQDGEN